MTSGWLRSALVAGFLLAFVHGSVAWGETEEQPPDWVPPASSDWDWLQLTSGEWVKGELEMLRDQLYVIANMALDAYDAAREPGDPTDLTRSETRGNA